ncbi:MAG: hypothetical protein LBR11_05210 [Deltaproteobacteria bacterium]|nr:hypothetical protein [Deltaproteobacteria bacterium]
MSLTYQDKTILLHPIDPSVWFSRTEVPPVAKSSALLISGGRLCFRLGFGLPNLTDSLLISWGVSLAEIQDNPQIAQAKTIELGYQGQVIARLNIWGSTLFNLLESLRLRQAFQSLDEMEKQYVSSLYQFPVFPEADRAAQLGLDTRRMSNVALRVKRKFQAKTTCHLQFLLFAKSPDFHNSPLLAFRENEILSHLVKGATFVETAQRLQLNFQERRQAKGRILAKLHARSLAEAARHFIVSTGREKNDFLLARDLGWRTLPKLSPPTPPSAAASPAQLTEAPPPSPEATAKSPAQEDPNAEKP